MLPVEYLSFNRTSFTISQKKKKNDGGHKTQKIEVNLVALSFGDITGFQAEVSVINTHKRSLPNDRQHGKPLMPCLARHVNN